MPLIDYREARARLSLAEALQLAGFEVSRRLGAQVRGPCPLHSDRLHGTDRTRRRKSRSFAVHLGKGVWHCFRCGAGGNVLDLWAALTRQPLYAATIDLCQRLGRDVPWLEESHCQEETTMPGA